MGYFEHDGVTFHYRESGAGIPFVFQHGLGGDNNQTFEACSPPPGFRLLTLDARAHGETRPVGNESKLDIATFAKDLAAWQDHLGLGPVIIGGISMGAALALHFSLTWPDRIRGLVLCRPAWLDQKRSEGFELFTLIAQLIRRYGAREGCDRFEQTDEFHRLLNESPDNAASLIGQFLLPRAEETVAKFERIPGHTPAFTRADWRRIAVPTLVLGNRRDVIHPFEFAEAYAQEIPGAELREITPKSTHRLRYQQELQAALSDFLIRHYSPVPPTSPASIC